MDFDPWPCVPVKVLCLQFFLVCSMVECSVLFAFELSNHKLQLKEYVVRVIRCNAGKLG